MLRTRLSSLLQLTALASGYLAVARNLGYLHAAILLAAFALVGWSLRSRRRGWIYAVRSLALVVGATVAWIAGLDGRWAFDNCLDCGWGRECLEYRVLGVPVWTDQEDNSETIYFVLRDLGWKCDHQRKDPWVKHRYWGGLFCACPCINGIMGVTGYPYTTAVSNQVKLSAAADPKLGNRLQQLFVNDMLGVYFREVLLVDWQTLAAHDEGTAREARDWLANAHDWSANRGENKPGVFYWMSRHQALHHIESLYGDGAEEVVVIWPTETDPWGNDPLVYSELVVRLPTDEERRRHLFCRMNMCCTAENCDPIEDHGQQFAYGY